MKKLTEYWTERHELPERLGTKKQSSERPKNRDWMEVQV